MQDITCELCHKYARGWPTTPTNHQVITHLSSLGLALTDPALQYHYQLLYLRLNRGLCYQGRRRILDSAIDLVLS